MSENESSNVDHQIQLNIDQISKEYDPSPYQAISYQELNSSGGQQQPLQEDYQDHNMLKKPIPPYKPTYLQNSVVPRKKQQRLSPAHFHQQPPFEKQRSIQYQNLKEQPQNQRLATFKRQDEIQPMDVEYDSLTSVQTHTDGMIQPMRSHKGLLKKVVLLGQTGSGKSTIGNILLGLDPRNGFDVSRGADSCTDETKTIKGAWCTNGYVCEVTDTPGMDDSENRDTEHIENIIEHLKAGQYINTFVLVRNGHNKRISNSFKSMLTIFELMFGSQFWQHVVVDVSHVSYDGEEGIEKEGKEWKKIIKKNFPKSKNAALPTVILDAKDPNNQRFIENAKILWSYCQNMENFECKDFETTKTEMDKMKFDLEQFKANAEEKMKKLMKDAEDEKKAMNEKAKQDLYLVKEENQKKLDKFEKESLKMMEELKQAKEENQKNAKFFAEELKEKENQMTKERKEIQDRHEKELKKVTEDAKEGLTKMTDTMHLLNKQNTENQEALILNATKQVEDIIFRNTEKVQRNVDEKISGLGQNLEHHVTNLSTRMDQQEMKLENTKATYESKINTMIEEGKKSEKDFENLYPALKTREDGSSPWKSLRGRHTKSMGNDNYKTISIEVFEDSPIINKDGGKAARILKVSGIANQKPTKTILVVGMTGSGKSTLIDALMNFVYDVRYEDDIRLKLIVLTDGEARKQANQATSQTDYITVYNIEWMPGMNIDFNLVIIDTPGLGDTRGIDYDKQMIKNIEVLFNSKEVDSLDCIGFVAKAGDVRLTAEQKYIFESILQIFGKDVGENLLSLLTFYDGNDLKVKDAFKEAKINFIENFPYNSFGIFQKRGLGPVERSLLTTHPNVSFYQDFYKNSNKFFKMVQGMKSRSLVLTKEVLKDREHIEATVEGLNIQVRELLLLKDRVDQEKRICEQHEADAKANENTEYEVEESKVIKIDLNAGEFVTNCLECNRTCHYPCYIQNDDEKYNCAAMGRGKSQDLTKCTVCPKECHWQQHRNMSFRLDVETTTVKKTYEDIKSRHQEFLDKHKGQLNIVQALEIESQELSDDIQRHVDVITDCLHRLSVNALRTSTTTSSEYLEQMIQAEDHERKPGFQRRIDQLMKEKAKADALRNIQSGKEIVSGVQITAKKAQNKPKIGRRKLQAPSQSYLHHTKKGDKYEDEDESAMTKAAKTGKKLVKGAAKALGL